MRAAVFSYPPHVEVNEVENPRPAKGEVLVKVKAAALCGTDLRIARRGHSAIAQGEKRILGHEVIGEVVELGEGIVDFKEGMLVAVAPNFGCGKCVMCAQGLTHHCPESKALGITFDGGFAEYLLVPENAVRQGNVFPLPEGADPVKLSFVEALACVVHGFLPLRVSFRDKVLIYGAGAIGLMFLELSKLSGAKKVWMVDLSEERLKIAEEHGAVGILAEEGVKGKVDNPDVVVVAAPAPRAQMEAIEVASLFGRINFFGGLPPQVKEVPIATNLIHYKELVVTGTTRSNNFYFKIALDLLLDGQLDLSYLVTHVLPLEDIEQGLYLMEKQEALKVVIVP